MKTVIRIFWTTFWIVIILAAGWFLIKDHLENKANLEAVDAEYKRSTSELEAALSSMVSNTDANTDWASYAITNNRRIMTEPIITVELENLWLGKRPILFYGAIKDIATYNETNYTVLVEPSYDCLSDDVKLWETEIQLSLSADKELIDSFLLQNQVHFQDYGLNHNCVAVIANINSIQSSYITEKVWLDGEVWMENDVKTGKGELVDIMLYERR